MSTKLPDLTSLSSLSDTDLVYVVDVSDMSDALDGSSKKVALSDLSAYTTTKFWPRTSAESSAGVTPTNYRYEPGNVLRYGATGDGVTNDATALQAAIDSSDWVYFPEGDYICNSALTLRTDTHIKGAGIGASRIIKNADVTSSQGLLYANSGSSSSYVSNIQISDIELEGLVSTKSFSEHQHLVSLSGVENVIIDRVKFSGFQGDGLYLGSVGGERHNKHVQITNCIFDGVNNDNRQGVSVIDGDHIIIDGCDFYDCTRSNMPGAIDVEPNANTYHVVRNIRITNNTFSNITGSAGVILFVLTAATFTTQPENFVISGNVYDTVKTALVFLSNATYTRPLNIVFSGNSGKIYNWADLRGNIDGISYSGNSFYTTGRGYLGNVSTDEVYNASFTGNTFVGDGSAQNKGWVLYGGSNVVFQGNAYSGLIEYTHSLSTTGSTLANVLIANEVVDCASGVYFPSGGTVSNIQIIDCDLTQCSSAVYGTVPSGLVLRNLNGQDLRSASSRTVQIWDNGKTFYCSNAGGMTFTLPAPLLGLKFSFIVEVAPTTAHIITTNSGANVLYGTLLDIVGEQVYFSAQDTINFVASTSVVGDRLDVESDGTRWHCKAVSGADGGITTSVT